MQLQTVLSQQSVWTLFTLVFYLMQYQHIFRESSESLYFFWLVPTVGSVIAFLGECSNPFLTPTMELLHL